jgi:hypothetical protein
VVPGGNTSGFSTTPGGHPFQNSPTFSPCLDSGGVFLSSPRPSSFQCLDSGGVSSFRSCLKTEPPSENKRVSFSFGVVDNERKAKERAEEKAKRREMTEKFFKKQLSRFETQFVPVGTKNSPSEKF